MAKYKTGIESKRKILAAAKKLFYHGGYAKTTVAAIAEEAGVPKGLIAYYYKKEELLTAIHREYVVSIVDAIDRLPAAGRLPRYLLFMQVFCQGIYCDEKNLALYRQIVDEGRQARDVQDLVEVTTRQVIQRYRPELGHWECEMLLAAQEGAHREVVGRHPFPLDPAAARKLFFWTGSIALRLAGVEESVIDAGITEAERLLGEMDISSIRFTV